MQIGTNASAGTATAVVLAGGRSSRMGCDKALLPWDDTSLLGHLLRGLQTEFAAVYLSARQPDAYRAFDVPLVPDTEPGRGPLCGIASTLAAVDTPWLFVTACDMPFSQPQMWRALAAHAMSDVDVVVPRIGAGVEPLCAFYHQRCLPVFRARLAAGRFAVHEAMHDLRVRDVDATAWQREDVPDPFANVNTPEEFAALRRVAGHQSDAALAGTRVRSKLWLERDGAMVFGGGRTDLLRHIERTGSINRAAANMHMSYRRAWGRIQQMEAALGCRLVERRTGGRNGGGSTLTREARELLRRFETLEAELDAYVSERFASVFDGSPV